MTDMGREVGTMRPSRKPEDANSASNSLAVRSLPPTVMTSISVEHLGRRWSWIVGHDHLANQHASVFRQLIAHQAQDGLTVLVAPVMDNVLEDVGVATVGYAVEEASRFDRDAPLAPREAR